MLATSRDVVLLAMAVGAATGLLVAGLERLIIHDLLDRVRELPLALVAIAPGVGLAASALALRRIGGGVSPSTADEYVKAIPKNDVPFDLRSVPARVIASIATLGTGGAGGLEGPSVFVGTAVGAAAHDRLRRVLRNVDRRAAVVAGAAAGVAAIFKAPATGAVFALEVPYQEDLTQHGLLPALVGAASGYVTFVAVNGTERLFPVSGNPDLALVDLAMAAAIGLTCGVGARAFAAVLGFAKRLRSRIGVMPRVLAAGVLMAALVVASDAAFDGELLTIGPGYGALEYALDPSRTLWLIALLATLRVLATATTVAGDGAAGMFIPLVLQGALTGRLLAGFTHADNQSLFIVVGVAAFLGAGYRVPLSAVMFVAEATGRPGFVVPGLIAATIAELVMGTSSVSTYQRRRRSDYVEQRAELPISTVLATDAATSRADDTIAQFFAEHVSLARRRAVPLVDGEGCYEGLVLLDDVLAVDPADWADTTLAEVAATELPVAGPDWTVGQALRQMVDANVDHLPVTDGEGRLRGMVTSDAIVDRNDLLERLSASRDARREHGI